MTPRILVVILAAVAAIAPTGCSTVSSCHTLANEHFHSASLELRPTASVLVVVAEGVLGWSTKADENDDRPRRLEQLPEFSSQVASHLPSVLSDYFAAADWGEPVESIDLSTRTSGDGGEGLAMQMPSAGSVYEFKGAQPDVVLLLTGIRPDVGYRSVARKSQLSGGSWTEHQELLQVVTEYVFWDNRLGQPINWGRFTSKVIMDRNWTEEEWRNVIDCFAAEMIPWASQG